MAHPKAGTPETERFRMTIEGRRALYSGFVIARLKTAGLSPSKREPSLVLLREFLATLADEQVPCRWLIDSEVLARLSSGAAAKEANGDPCAQLKRVARVDLRPHPDRLASFVSRLRLKEDLVELAYAELAVTFESKFAAPSGQCMDQNYLGNAPDGIAARKYWKETDLSRCRLVDIEGAWLLTHEDVDNGKLELLNNQMNRNCNECVNHGTSVLGVLVAKDNELGGTGVVPDIPSVGLVSTWAPDGSDDNVANAILAAMARWGAPDYANVLLLEVQRDDPPLPTEVDLCDWQAIRCAVDHGMLVVEAAASGDHEIAPLPSGAAKDPGMPGRRVGTRKIQLEDSGAVIVAAGRHDTVQDTSGTPVHALERGSNFGTRINCYAWGDCIYTTSALRYEPYCDFGGTSGAAAIMAGAAALIQGVRSRRKQKFLDPETLRATLASYGTGTLFPKQAPVGLMPDLAEILK